jgi:hypothetical protein
MVWNLTEVLCMVRLHRVALLTLLALTGGCLPTDFLQTDTPTTGTALVPNSPFGSAAPTFRPVSAPKATETGFAIKVDEIGQKLIAANKSLGIKPLFSTIGSPQSEIFHQSTAAVIITEGLVRQCKTEGQLAALLAVELGRMIAERETLASPESRNPDRPPPISVPMGNAGQFSGLDQLNQAEMAKFDRDRRRPSKKFVPPDPVVLARGYLEAAGFDVHELDAVAPLLADAEKNYVLEKQFKGASSPPTAQPR